MDYIWQEMTQFYWRRIYRAICQVGRSLDKPWETSKTGREKENPNYTFGQVSDYMFFIGRMAQRWSRVKKRN